MDSDGDLDGRVAKSGVESRHRPRGFSARNWSAAVRTRPTRKPFPFLKSVKSVKHAVSSPRAPDPVRSTAGWIRLRSLLGEARAGAHSSVSVPRLACAGDASSFRTVEPCPLAILGSLPGFGVSGAPWPHSQSGSILITIAPGTSLACNTRRTANDPRRAGQL